MAPALHLTFDDGPDPERTPAVLEALARHGAQATFFVLGTAQPSQVVNLGKPAPDPDGKIRVNFTPLLTSWPAAGVVHEARVVAVGSNGVGTSTPSNTFVFTAQCGASLSPVSVSVGPASSTGNVVVSAAAGCAWTGEKASARGMPPGTGKRRFSRSTAPPGSTRRMDRPPSR